MKSVRSRSSAAALSSSGIHRFVKSGCSFRIATTFVTVSGLDFLRSRYAIAPETIWPDLFQASADVHKQRHEVSITARALVHVRMSTASPSLGERPTLTW